MKKSHAFVGLGVGLILLATFLIVKKQAPETATVQSSVPAEVQKNSKQKKSTFRVASASKPPANTQDVQTTLLNEQERALFFKDVDFVFGKLALAGVDNEAMAEHLSRLNRRGPAGVEAIAQTLAKPTMVDNEVRQRIALVDYIAYRARWDENAKAKIIAILDQRFPENVPTKYRSVLVAERAELLGSLAALDWQTAAPLLAKISDPLLRKYAASESAFKLAEGRISLEQAKSQVRTVVPDLKI